MANSRNRRSGGRHKSRRRDEDIGRRIEETGLKQVREEPEEEYTPTAVVLTNMPGGYTKTQLNAGIRAFIAPKGKLLTPDDVGSSTEGGSLYSLVHGIKDMLERSDKQEMKGIMSISQGQGEATQAMTKKVSAKDIATVIEGILYNKTVDISRFKHLFLGYDPSLDDRKAFNQIFEHVIEGRVQKKLGGIDEGQRRAQEEGIRREVEDEVWGEFGDTQIKGIMHRGRRRNPQLKKGFKNVTVADALALRMWAGDDHTPRLDARTGENVGVASELDKLVAGAAREHIVNAFTFLRETDESQITDPAKEFSKKYGVEFNEYLTKTLGWIVRDTVNRVHQRFLAITMRFRPKDIWGLLAEMKGVSDDVRRGEAEKKIKLWWDAHGDTLEEVRSREDFGSWEKNMSMAWHKGADDFTIQKKSVFGLANPDWKPVQCQRIIQEMFYDFREIESERPDFKTETDFQRYVQDKMWRRMDNQWLKDADGNFVLGQQFRDADGMDMVPEGQATLQDLTWAYVKRTWGGRDQRAEESRIRGFNRLIFHVKSDDLKVIDESPALESTLVTLVNRQRAARNDDREVTDITQLEDADLTEGIGKRMGELGYRIFGVYNQKTLADKVRDLKLSRNLLNSVNAEQGLRLRHIDEIDEAHVTYDVVAASGFMDTIREEGVDEVIKRRAERVGVNVEDRNELDGFLQGEGLASLEGQERVRKLSQLELVDRLAKTRLVHDMKRGTFIFLFTYAQKANVLASPDVETLRMRSVFHDRMTDPAAYNLLRYELREMARAKPQLIGGGRDTSLTVDGDFATREDAAAIRRYAHALRDEQELIGEIFTSTQWRKISGPEASDPALANWRMRVWDDYLFTVKRKNKLDVVAALAGDSQVNQRILLHTLLNLDERFANRNDGMVKAAIERSNRYEKFKNTDGQTFGYSRYYVTEALRNSTPRGTYEKDELKWARIRIARLFGKYGDRLKAMRSKLDNPYSPVGNPLVYGDVVKPERDALIGDLTADVFSERGEFKRVGDGLKEKAFVEHCRLGGLDLKDGDSERERAEKLRRQEQEKKSWAFGSESSRHAVTQLFIFLSVVHAYYRGFGEQLADTNEYGRAGMEPQHVDSGRLIDAIATPDAQGNISIQIERFTEDPNDPKVVSPRSRRRRYRNTDVMNGVSILDGAWANQSRAIALMTEDPYTRQFMLNLADNQRDALSTEPRLDKNMILDQSLIDAAQSLGLHNPDITEFGEWVRYYSQAIIRKDEAREHMEQAGCLKKQGNDVEAKSLEDQARVEMQEAVDHYSDAYTKSMSFRYRPDGVDLRVVTLNQRGWAKKELADSMPEETDSGEMRVRYQDSLDDFNAAFLTSRDEGADLALNKARGWWRRIIYWGQNRFSYGQMGVEEGENAESMAGMGAVNAKLSKYSRIAGDESRKWFLRSGVLAAGTAVAGVATGGLALAGIGTGIAVGSAIGVALAERRWLGKYWADRARDTLEDFYGGGNGDYNPDMLNPRNSRSYITAYEQRTVNLGRAEAYTNSADGSWFRFLRSNYLTWSWDAGAHRDYEEAARTLDSLTSNHILHAFNVRMEDRSNLIEEVYQDTYRARELKRRALQSRGNYYQAAWEALEEPTQSTEELPYVANLFNTAMTRYNIEPGGLWNGVLTLGGLDFFLSKRYGYRWATSTLMRDMANNQNEVTSLPQQGGVGPYFNNRVALMLLDMAGKEKETRLKGGYLEIAKQGLQIAKAKWRRLFMGDDSVVQSDAMRNTVTNAVELLSGQQPTETVR